MYDFRLMRKECQKTMLESKLFIDEERFDPTKDYNYKVKHISFENNNGRVSLRGYYELPSPNSKIIDIIKIQRNSVKFEPSFLDKNMNHEMFHSFELMINFYNITQDMNFLNSKEFEMYLLTLPAIKSFSDNKLVLSLNRLRDVDLKPFMAVKDRFFEENVDRTNFPGFQIGPDFNEERIYKGKRIFKDEKGVNKSYEEEKEFNLADHKILEDLDIEDVVMPPEIANANFIDFEKDSKEFEFTNEKFIINSDQQLNFNDPYHLKSENKLKAFRKSYKNNSFKVCFNHKGEFITLGKFNANTQRHNLNINKIIPNKNLQLEGRVEKNNGLEFYKNNTIINYLQILYLKISEKTEASVMQLDIENVNNKSFPESPIFKKNQSQIRMLNLTSTVKKSVLPKKEEINTVDLLGVNDYTFIINDYINHLIRDKEQIKTPSTSISPTDRRYKLVTESLLSKLDKEISTLKLFKILFLNTFLDNNNNSNINFNWRKETQQVNVESLREEVKKMRKKKLLDWMIENTEKDFNKEFEEISKNGDESSVHKLILHCLLSGRIKKAIDICNKNNLFNLAMMISQTNIDPKSKLIKNSISNWDRVNLFSSFSPELKKIYNVLSNSDDIENVKEILKDCDWRKAFIYISLFTQTPSTHVSTIIRKFEEITQLPDFNQRNILPRSTENIENINYLLILLYSNIEQQTVGEVLNKLCYSSNIFPGEFTDHHIQYLIITILLNTLKESYNFNYQTEKRPNEVPSSFYINNIINFKILKENHIKLLLKIHEEVLVSEGTTTDLNWKYAITLINHSNMCKKNKILLENQILYRNVETASKDPSFFNPEIFNPFITREAQAFFQLAKFDLPQAYENFKEAKNFEKACEIYIFNFLCVNIIQNNINNENFDELRTLAKNAHSVFVWEKYGTVFLEYLTYKTKYENNRDSPRDVEEMLNLLTKVEALNAISDVTYEKTINFCRGIMIKNIRRIYNSKLNNRNKEFHSCITPNISWIKDNNLQMSLKLNEFNESVNSVIQQKSKTFSK